MAAIFVFLVLAVIPKAVESCCTPEQWQMEGGSIKGQILQEGALLTIVERTFDMYYDGVNRKVAIVTKKVGDPDFRNTTILDYSSERMYEILQPDNTCRVLPLTREFRPACTPDDATVTKHFFYGGGDQKRLPAAVFRFVRPAYSGYIHVTEGTSPTSTCVPIIAYNFNLSFMEFMTFMNIMDGVENPNVFIPPAICTQFRSGPNGNERKLGPIHDFLNVPVGLLH